MHSITVKASTLKAAAILAAKKDVRYYLLGVLIQATAKETRVVGCDGHLLGVFRTSPVEGNNVSGLVEFILPREVLDNLKVPAKGHQWATIKIDEQEAGKPRRGVLEFGALSAGFTAVDGVFPDYRRVIPTGGMDGIAAQLNPELVDRMHKAACTFEDSRKALIHITHNGPSNACLVTCGVDTFVGVIMPIRSDAAVTDGQWAKEALPSADQPLKAAA